MPGSFALLDSWSDGSETTTVHGYKVRTTTARLDVDEAERRRSAVASVIARSLQSKKE